MWEWMGGTGGMGGAGWLWMAVWWLFALVLLVLAVLAVVWLTRNLGGDRGRPPAGRQSGAVASARETLDLRYARGELSRDEYHQVRRDLDDPTARDEEKSR